MKNKKNIYGIIVCIIMIASIILFLFIFNNNNQQLVLKCVSERSKNQYFLLDRFVNVYIKGKEILYNDNVNIEKLTDDEKINEAIDSYILLMYKYDEYTKNNFFTLIKEENNLNLILDINLSNYTSSEIKQFIGASDTSVKGLKLFLESEGLLCEEY